jgi:hypothetical protein
MRPNEPIASWRLGWLVEHKVNSFYSTGHNDAT